MSCPAAAAAASFNQLYAGYRECGAAATAAAAMDRRNSNGAAATAIGSAGAIVRACYCRCYSTAAADRAGYGLSWQNAETRINDSAGCANPANRRCRARRCAGTATRCGDCGASAIWNGGRNRASRAEVVIRCVGRRICMGWCRRKYRRDSDQGHAAMPLKAGSARNCTV